MPLIQNSYGKGRVRVMRVHREGTYNEVRELSVQTMLEGDFAAAYTAGDNRTVVATDTIKNITYIVARENMTADAELFGQALASRFLARYPQVDRVIVKTHETRWGRASIAGAPHPHSFVLDGNGKPTAEVVATREATSLASGISGYTFMKSTESGWVDYVFDEYTTLPPTTDPDRGDVDGCDLDLAVPADRFHGHECAHSCGHAGGVRYHIQLWGAG